MSTASWKNQGGFSKHRNVGSVTIQNQKDISTLNLSLYEYKTLPNPVPFNPGTIIYSQNKLYYKDEVTLTWDHIQTSGGDVGLWSKEGGGNNIYYNSGNVGIGLNNPNVALDVSGNVVIGQDAFRSKLTLKCTSAGTDKGLIIYDSSFDQSGLYTKLNTITDKTRLAIGISYKSPGGPIDIDNVLVLKATSAQMMVGIGIPDPQYTLDISGNINVNAVNY